MKEFSKLIPMVGMCTPIAFRRVPGKLLPFVCDGLDEICLWTEKIFVKYQQFFGEYESGYYETRGRYVYPTRMNLGVKPCGKIFIASRLYSSRLSEKDVDIANEKNLLSLAAANGNSSNKKVVRL